MVKSKQTAFLKLYEPVHDRFEKFCRARVYGDMEYTDLMNETLLIAFKKFENLQSDQAFLSFLFGISVRILSNNAKKNKTETIGQDTTFIQITDLNADSEKDTNIFLLYQALALLPEDQRECVILFEIIGFSIKEIMVIQDVSESAIKQRLRRGRLRLHEILIFESEHKRGEVIQ